MSRARALVVALVAVAASGACAAPPSAGVVASSTASTSLLASAELLAPAGKGTLVDALDPATVHAWVDARVANTRFHKRVFVEVSALYEGGAVMRTLAPASFRSELGGGAERWGTDALEIFPTGGPDRRRLAGAVLYRLRAQADVDGDGRDEMVVTAWAPLYGEGEARPPAVDPWAPGLVSPRPEPATSASAPASRSTEVLFPPFDDAGAAVVREIDAVRAAKVADPEGRHTIHAAVFNINDPRIVDALIDAHRAGVEVRLVTDAGKLRPQATWQTGDDALLRAGVPLLGVRRPGRGAMHMKLAVFDGRRAATGSFNWEAGSSHENHENMVVIDDPEIVAAYAERFEALAGGVMIGRGRGHDRGADASVAFGPDEQLAERVGALIDGARARVLVAMFTAKEFFYDERGARASLFHKLIEARRRGVRVTLLTDARVAEGDEYFGVRSPDDPTDEALEAGGVHVIRVSNPFGRYASMHHKLMVVDDDVVVTGAFNWYYDAAFVNDEDALVLRDPALVARFAGEITDLLRRYDPGYDAGAWPETELRIQVRHAGTRWGDRLLLLGDVDELGGWSPGRALSLEATEWPAWRGSLTLPAGVRVKCKLAVRHPDGSLSWEQGGDRTLTLPTAPPNGRARNVAAVDLEYR